MSIFLALAGLIFSFDFDCASERSISMAAHDAISAMRGLSREEKRWNAKQTVSTFALILPLTHISTSA